MLFNSKRTSRVLLTVCIISISGTGLPSTTYAELPGGELGEWYIGPAWGHAVSWDPDFWEVDLKSSEADHDRLELVSDIDRLTIEAFRD